MYFLISYLVSFFKYFFAKIIDLEDKSIPVTKFFFLANLKIKPVPQPTSKMFFLILDLLISI